MSKRQKFKSRDKVTQKMTRDGLMARNEATGEDIKLTDRDAEFNTQFMPPERETFSQHGKRTQTPADDSRRGQPRPHDKREAEPAPEPGVSEEPQPSLRFSEGQRAAEAQAETMQTAEPEDAPTAEAPRPTPVADGRRTEVKPPGARPPKPRQTARYAEHQPVTAEAPAAPAPEYNHAPNKEAEPSEPVTGSAAVESPPPKVTEGKPGSRLNTDNGGRLKFAREEAAPQRKRPKPQKGGAPAPEPTYRPAEQPQADSTGEPLVPATPETPVPPETEATTGDAVIQTAPAPQSDASPVPAVSVTPGTHTPKPGKPGKLQFTKEEAAPDTPIITPNRKLGKAEKQAERVAEKLERAKDTLPAKRKLRKVSVPDTKTGAVKRKLQFEKTPVSQSEHIKGARPLRPVKAVGNSAIAFGHRKLYQVEHENVSVKAAHRAEMFAEGGVRSALRFRKTAPFRKVAKLERAAAKKSINLTYQRTLAQNPKLKGNILTRALQKRKIKKDYAKAARKAQKAAKKAKQAGSAVSAVGKALLGFVRRHPLLSAAIVIVVLLIYAIISLFSAFGGMGSGGVGGIITASYLAEDADIDSAEVAYTEWETDLRMQIAATESDRPGFDEYLYSIGGIGHSPYELMAYLTVVYQNFPYDAISGDMRALFDEQYSLTHTETTETRYADPEDANEDGDTEPYEWTILTVTLTARPFSDVALSRLSDEQTAQYALLLETKGARAYVGKPFAFDWLPYVSSYYGYRVHPISGDKDLHRGIDIGIAAGTEIVSAQDGTVTFAGYSGDYGNVVVVEGADGLVTKYAHCEALLVSAGQTVGMGDPIATVGSTGSSTGPHLHFEVLKDGIYLNPAYFADTGSITF